MLSEKDQELYDILNDRLNKENVDESIDFILKFRKDIDGANFVIKFLENINIEEVKEWINHSPLNEKLDFKSVPSSIVYDYITDDIVGFAPTSCLLILFTQISLGLDGGLANIPKCIKVLEEHIDKTKQYLDEEMEDLKSQVMDFFPELVNYECSKRMQYIFFDKIFDLLLDCRKQNKDYTSTVWNFAMNERVIHEIKKVRDLENINMLDKSIEATLKKYQHFDLTSSIDRDCIAESIIKALKFKEREISNRVEYTVG